MNAELRHLRYFVAVAEELHFTRAAQRMHIAQQPLSAAIRKLERELGVELFTRSTRQVELTDAGRALLDPARRAIDAADAAFSLARGLGAGEAGVLSVGISPAARYGVDPLFDALRARYPAVQVRTRLEASRLLIEGLCAGQLDFGIGFCATVPPELAARRLLDANAVVVIARTHRLAKRRRVTLADLREEVIALADPVDTDGYNHAILAACERVGFEPRVRQAVGDHRAWERAVAEGGCVGITGACATYAHASGLRTIRLDPLMTFPVDLLWLASNHDRPLHRSLIGIADTVAGH